MYTKLNWEAFCVLYNFEAKARGKNSSFCAVTISLRCKINFGRKELQRKCAEVMSNLIKFPFSTSFVEIYMKALKKLPEAFRSLDDVINVQSPPLCRCRKPLKHSKSFKSLKGNRSSWNLITETIKLARVGFDCMEWLHPGDLICNFPRQALVGEIHTCVDIKN